MTGIDLLGGGEDKEMVDVLVQQEVLNIRSQFLKYIGLAIMFGYIPRLLYFYKLFGFVFDCGLSNDDSSDRQGFATALIFL